MYATQAAKDFQRQWLLTQLLCPATFKNETKYFLVSIRHKVCILIFSIASGFMKTLHLAAKRKIKINQLKNWFRIIRNPMAYPSIFGIFESAQNNSVHVTHRSGLSKTAGLTTIVWYSAIFLLNCGCFSSIVSLLNSIINLQINAVFYTNNKQIK